MHNRLYSFLKKKNELIFLLELGPRQKHIALHALTHVTDKTRNEIDEGNYARKIIVDF